MNQLTSKLLVRELKIKKNKIRQEQIKEEDIDMIENLYQKAITNINIKDESKIDQMNNWSIFSDKLRYVDSSINDTSKLNIRPLDKNKHRWFFNALEMQEN